jgi:hypothetical protein
MTASDRLAIFLIGLAIDWQHLAKGTSCKRDGSAGDEGGCDGGWRRSFSGLCKKKGAYMSSRPH